MRIVFLCLLLIPEFLYSQDIPEKKFDHYASVQINQLIKQVINLSNAPDIQNPFLLEYMIIGNKSNLGLNTGFGYTITNSSDHENPDANSLKESALSFYIGICARQKISQKFELTYGIDYVKQIQKNESSSYSVTDFGNGTDSTHFYASDESRSWGGGLDVTMRYSFSKRILVGTQLTYYYLSTTTKSSSETFNKRIFDQSIPSVITNDTTFHQTDNEEFKLVLPVSFYLIIKF